MILTFISVQGLRHEIKRIPTFLFRSKTSEACALNELDNSVISDKVTCSYILICLMKI